MATSVRYGETHLSVEGSLFTKKAVYWCIDEGTKASFLDKELVTRQ